MILYKKNPRQKVLITSENAWFTILGFSFPRIYFLQFFFSWDLISWDFIGNPHTILEKKVPGIQNTGLYLRWHFFQGLDKIRTFFQSFYFQVFFQKLFIPGLSYIDSFSVKYSFTCNVFLHVLRIIHLIPREMFSSIWKTVRLMQRSVN